jgi:hypothetical protein
VTLPRPGGAVKLRRQVRAFGATIDGEPMRSSSLLVAAVIAAVTVSADRAQACSSATCSLVGRSDEGKLGRGRFRLELSFRHIGQGRRLYGSHALEVWGAADPPVLRPRVDYAARRFIQGYHQEYFERTEASQVDVSYGLTARLVATVSIPIVSRTLNHFHVATAGATTGPHLGELGGRLDLATSGLGDAQVTLRYALGGGLAVGGAAKLATGGADRLDENGTVADPMVQPGSGALALVATVQYAGAEPLPGGISWSAIASLERAFTNDLGYRFGDEAFVVASAGRALHGSLAATLQLKASQAGRNRFLGIASTSTGATVVYAAPGLRARLPGGLGVYGNVQLPVYQHVNEGQLAIDAVLQAGVSRTF